MGWWTTLADWYQPSHLVSVCRSWWPLMGDTGIVTLCGHSHMSIHKYMGYLVKSGLSALTSRHSYSGFPDFPLASFPAKTVVNSVRMECHNSFQQFHEDKRKQFQLIFQKSVVIYFHLSSNALGPLSQIHDVLILVEYQAESSHWICGCRPCQGRGNFTS